MKEQLFAVAKLGASDRAALQGLIPLAGVVGTGAIFSLFAGGRRGTGFKVFEVFAIVAVLSAAALTAALSIDQLQADKAITNRDLTQTAMPLIIATLLLVVVSVVERLDGSWERLLVLLPFVVAAIYVAAELTASSWSVNPGKAMWLVMAIVAIGLVLAGLGWAVDRDRTRSERRAQQDRVRRLVELGYVPAQLSLAPALPRVAGEGAELSGWAKGDMKLLEYDDAERLRDLVRARWDALAAGQAEGAVGDTILLDVQLQHWARRGRGPGRLSVTVLRPNEKEREQTIDLRSDENRLFDASPIVT